MRAPLEPDLPIASDAPLTAPDADEIEVLKDSQTLADTHPTAVAGEHVDRKRAEILSGGDVDAAWDQADAGEETVGGSTPTPDQDVVDELGRAASVTYSDTEPRRPEEKVAIRDDQRWEIDPASSEDYLERQEEMRRRSRKRP